MAILVCEQCNGTGECKPGVRCPCREEDDAADDRRKQMRILDREVRPELLPLPTFMKDLRVSRGYPVPWFVDWINGEPEFRAMDQRKFAQAIKDRLCWTCGKPLWEESVFVIGPMCAINRISSEPASHRECARFSARACPFLSKPKAIRRADEKFDAAKIASPGLMVERNPGVTLLWFTRRYELINSPRIDKVGAGAGAGVLFKLGRPFKTEWYREGRAATRAEIMESINTGLLLFHEANEKQGIDPAAGRAEIERQLAEAMRLVPR